MTTQSSDYSFSSAQSSSIPAGVGILQLQDRGHSFWRRVATQPAHPAYFRSQDRYLPDGSTDNSNGGYWEFQPTDGIIDVEEFGLVADGTTDNSPAMTNLLTYIGAKRANVFESNGGGYRIRFPIGHFYFGSRIELKSTVIMEGQGSGMAHGVGTKLRFASGGIVINQFDTLNGAIETPPTTTASATIIRNLMVASSAASGAHDGIYLRSRATIEQVLVSAFPRHGIRIEGEGLSAAAEVRGNANGWRVINCRLDGNGDCGLFVSGYDSNAGIGIGIDAVANGNWGIWDNSFLGNAYLGCHADLNGVPGVSAGGRSAPAVVSHNGKLYAVVPGQDTAASTTTPGTNAWIWFDFWTGEMPAGVAPWTSGGTYKSGGPYALIGDAGSGALLEGCYSEGSQGPSFLGSQAISINGTHGGGIGGHGCALRGRGQLESRRGFVTATDHQGGAISIGGDAPNGDIIRIGHPANSPSTHRLMWKAGGDLSFNYNSSIATEPFFMTGPATTTKFGSAVAHPHVFALDKLALGAGYNGEGPDAGRRITCRSAAPASGDWARGDFVFNLNPSAGAPLGWRCTAAGAPGTWEAVAPAASPTFTGTVATADISASGRIDAGNVISVSGGNGFTGGNRLHIFYNGGGSIQGYNSATATYLPITLNGSELTFAIGLTPILTVPAAGTGIDVTGEARCDSLRIDAAPTAAAVTQTHHVPVNINGVTYKLLLAS